MREGETHHTGHNSCNYIPEVVIIWKIWILPVYMHSAQHGNPVHPWGACGQTHGKEDLSIPSRLKMPPHPHETEKYQYIDRDGDTGRSRHYTPSISEVVVRDTKLTLWEKIEYWQKLCRELERLVHTRKWSPVDTIAARIAPHTTFFFGGLSPPPIK